MSRSCINLVGNTTFGQNIGTGCGIYAGKGAGNLLQFKTLLPTGSSMYIYETDSEIIFCATGSGGTGGTTYTFTNGLTESGSVARLGGTLTGTTTINSSASNYFLVCSIGGADLLWKVGDTIYACYNSGSGVGSRFLMNQGSLTCMGYQNGSGSIGFITDSTTCSALRRSQSVNDCHYFGVFSSGATIYSSDNIYLKNVSAATQSYVLYYDSSTGLVSYSDGGGGGFLGTVSSGSTEPSCLVDNQWVKPAPVASNCGFNYTFSNFSDSGGTAISVNLSLEDVFLRFCQTGGTGAGYWIKEYYDRPISSGHTWIGTSGCSVCEIPVIDEWVTSEASVNYIGQKYAYPTHSVMMTEVGTCYNFGSIIYKQTINLDTATCTCLFTIPTGKIAMIRSAKLVMLCNATPTCFVIGIGNNSATYNNMVSNCEINDVSQYEVYELTETVNEPSSNAAACASGADVFFNVLTGSTCGNNLCAHLLVEGFVF